MNNNDTTIKANDFATVISNTGGQAWSKMKSLLDEQAKMDRNHPEYSAMSSEIIRLAGVRDDSILAVRTIYCFLDMLNDNLSADEAVKKLLVSSTAEDYLPFRKG